MISFDQAVVIVRGVARPLASEIVAVADAHRRVLAEAVVARVDAPPCDVSAMDGYAVRDSDLSTLPASLQVAGESYAGSQGGGAVAAGECVRIFTGAPLPEGADRVVIQEVVKREGDTAIIATAPGPARHIRRRANDFATGAILAEAGTRLGYRDLVVVAGGDVGEVPVWRRPCVTIIGTGDELADPGCAAGIPGAIPESVSLGVAALIEDVGATVSSRVRLRDELETMKRAATEAASASDLIVVTGGASVGERDFAKTMFAELGLQLLIAKVAIKPGKPVWLGRVGTTLVMGLPGNPTSALVTARLLLAPLVAGLCGLDPLSTHRWHEAPLRQPIAATGDRETFLRGRFAEGGVIPTSNQDSSAQQALAASSLLIRRRPSAPALEPGETVEVLEF